MEDVEHSIGEHERPLAGSDARRELLRRAYLRFESGLHGFSYLTR
jgi:hypothetical protein